MGKTLGEVLREHRIKAGFTVKEISDLLINNGFKASDKTVYSWENNNSQPNPDAFLLLCEQYKIDNILESFGYQSIEETKKPIAEPSPFELDMIKKYRRLDRHGKKIVDAVLGIENDRAESYYKRQEAERAKKKTTVWASPGIRRYPANVIPIEDISLEDTEGDMITLPVYDAGASAGTGVFLDSSNYEMVAMPDSRLNSRANFGVWVEGDSMEPRFSNGDLVLVRTQPSVDIGDIGIFVLNGEGYIKKLGKNKLVSLNPAYNDIEIGEDDSVYVKGKVLGKA